MWTGALSGIRQEKYWNKFNTFGNSLGITRCIVYYFVGVIISWPFQYQLHKMIKHTQTIRQLLAELFECVWTFCGVGV